MPPRDVDCNPIYTIGFTYHYHELMERILGVEFIQLHPGVESSEGYETEIDSMPDDDEGVGDETEIESLPDSEDDEGEIIDLTDPDVYATIMAHINADVRPIDS